MDVCNINKYYKSLIFLGILLFTLGISGITPSYSQLTTPETFETPVSQQMTNPGLSNTLLQPSDTSIQQSINCNQ